MRGLKIDHLIALVHIFDVYEDFIKDLDALRNLYEEKALSISDLVSLEGKFHRGTDLNDNNLKKFYDDNVKVFSMIDKYLPNFINFIDCYCYLSSSYNNFYTYLKNNQERLADILLLLEKLKQLGVRKLLLDENVDFKTQMFRINTDFSSNNTVQYNKHVYYMENIRIVPTSQSDIVKFKTEGSDYLISADCYCNNSIGYFTIMTNNLLFDPSKLPNKITKELLFDDIIELKKEKQDACDLVRDSVDLSLGIDKLEELYSRIQNIDFKAMSEEDRIKTRQALSEFQLLIKNLKEIQTGYNNSVINEIAITQRELDEEKSYLISKGV